MVFRRAPLHVKLADFGAAKTADTFHTLIGTACYAAPELFTGHYTSAVDVWSLGIVTVQLLYGLPRLSQKSEDEPWGRRVVTYLCERDMDPLRDFILSGMLRWEPQARLPAAQCLVKMTELHLFDEEFQTGARTPTSHSSRYPSEDTSTVQLPSDLFRAHHRQTGPRKHLTVGKRSETYGATRALRRRIIREVRPSTDHMTRKKGNSSMRLVTSE